jgi:glyoxylase-like metal-dependent hydrolase (beta-lactamase superfamily II)
VTIWDVGAVKVERVSEPGFELVLPQDPSIRALLRANESWLAPAFVTDELALRIGASATVVHSEGLTIVVDPWLVFGGPDPDARNDGLIAALEQAGTKAEDVDVVAYTHIDGVGALGCFPNARYLLTGPELQRDDIADAAAAIEATGQLDIVDAGHRITSEVTLEAAPGHSAGHVVASIESGGAAAVVAGHLFLHPSQVAAHGARPGLDEDPAVAAVTRGALLERMASAGALLIGPLFAEPGGGVVVRAGDSYQLSPSSC